MLAIGWSYLSPRVPNGMPPPCFPQSCPELGYYAILAVAGFFIVLWGLPETILGLLTRGGYVQPRSGPLPPPEPGSGPEDEIILSMARDFQNEVKRPKFGSIVGLAWSEVQPWYASGFKRQGLRGPVTLLLYRDLRGKLGIDEWRTLLAYYFRSLKIASRMVPEFIGYSFGPIFLFILGGLATSLIYGTRGGVLYGQLVGGPGTIIFLILIFPTVKRLQKRQEKSVAHSMGQDVLLNLFKKIDQLHLPQIESAKKRTGMVARLWPMPNITERIENLEKK